MLFHFHWNKIELESRKRERALKEQQEHLDLELEKRLSAMSTEIRDKVKKETEDEYRSTIAEMQKELVAEEANELESMPDWKARVLGLRKEDVI